MEPSDRLTITLIAADRPCRECTAARRTLEALAQRLGGQLALRELCRSDAEASRYGVILTPVVAVDGVVFSMGRRPPPRRLEAYVREKLHAP